MTNDELAAIRARCEAATNAPWRVQIGYDGSDWLIGTSGHWDGYKDYGVAITTDCVHASELRGDAKDDAEFIAAARTDIPALLAHSDAQAARIAELEARQTPRPIESAPDDEWVLVFDKITKWWICRRGGDAQWLNHAMSGKPLTHWLPMPPAPEVTP